MKKRSGASSLAYIALGSALICVSAWIAIPWPIPFTLQTLGVFLVLELLGGAGGTAAVLIYVAMGMLGLPVFSGFQGGLGVLLGPTGGFIVGFAAAGPIYWLITRAGRRSRITRILAMTAGLLVCYTLGCVRYAFGYTSSTIAGFSAAVMQCVLPFIIPDIIKLLSAYVLAGIIRRRARLRHL